MCVCMYVYVYIYIYIYIHIKIISHIYTHIIYMYTTQRDGSALHVALQALNS